MRIILLVIAVATSLLGDCSSEFKTIDSARSLTAVPDTLQLGTKAPASQSVVK